MVSQLFSGLSSLGLSTGQEHYVEDTTLAVPLSTQEIKFWVATNHKIQGETSVVT